MVPVLKPIKSFGQRSFYLNLRLSICQSPGVRNNIKISLQQDPLAVSALEPPTRAGHNNRPAATMEYIAHRIS